MGGARKDRPQMWMFGGSWKEGEEVLVGSQAERRPGAFVQVGRPSEGLPKGICEAGGETDDRRRLPQWETLEVVTPGRVGEKGRTQVAGAGFDRWGTQTRVLAQPQRADL